MQQKRCLLLSQDRCLLLRQEKCLLMGKGRCLLLSMPEPMLSLSMLILATKSVLSRGTILMGIAVWRVAEKANIAIWVGRPPPPPKIQQPPLWG